MNPKNALFLSASLTAFVLAVLFGVVTKISNTTAQAAAPEAAVAQASALPTQTPIPTLEQPTDLPAPTAQLPPTPEEAVQLAATAINRQDVYSVESLKYQGLDAFKVVFSSGAIVYIGMDRQVITKAKLQAVVAAVDPTQPVKKKNKNNNNNNNTTQSASQPGGGENQSAPQPQHDD